MQGTSCPFMPLSKWKCDDLCSFCGPKTSVEATSSDADLPNERVDPGEVVLIVQVYKPMKMPEMLTKYTTQGYLNYKASAPLAALWLPCEQTKTHSILWRYRLCFWSTVWLKGLLTRRHPCVFSLHVAILFSARVLDVSLGKNPSHVRSKPELKRRACLCCWQNRQEICLRLTKIVLWQAVCFSWDALWAAYLDWLDNGKRN